MEVRWGQHGGDWTMNGGSSHEWKAAAAAESEEGGRGDRPGSGGQGLGSQVAHLLSELSGSHGPGVKGKLHTADPSTNSGLPQSLVNNK